MTPRRSIHFKFRVVQVTFIHMGSFPQHLRHVVSETFEFYFYQCGGSPQKVYSNFLAIVSFGSLRQNGLNAAGENKIRIWQIKSVASIGKG